MSGLTQTPFLFFVAALASIGYSASDIYLPALAEIETDLTTTPALAGLTFSVYMAGFAVAQLIYGPLSDHHGRKPVLIFGLTLFLLATLGCALSSNIQMLLAFRLLQALGICAATVTWQPLIIDRFNSQEITKIFTLMISLSAVSPALAPVIGGWVAHHYSWRLIFLILFICAIILLCFTLFCLTETLNKEQQKKSPSWHSVFKGYRILARSLVFWGFTFTLALSVSSYFVFITLLPFVLSNIHFTAEQIGLSLFPMAVSFIIGTYISNRILSWDEMKTIQVGLFTTCVGAVFFWLLSLTFSYHSGWQVITPYCFISLFQGFVVATTSAFVVKQFRHIAGTCASSVGFIQAMLAFTMTAIGSFFVEQYSLLAITSLVLILHCLALPAYYVGYHALNNLSSDTSH